MIFWYMKQPPSITLIWILICNLDATIKTSRPVNKQDMSFFQQILKSETVARWLACYRMSLSHIPATLHSLSLAQWCISFIKLNFLSQTIYTNILNQAIIWCCQRKAAEIIAVVDDVKTLSLRIPQQFTV